jgi:hypothetical protein
MKQDRTNLYLKARDRLKALDPGLTPHALSALVKATIERGLVLEKRDGEIVFLRGDDAVMR